MKQEVVSLSGLAKYIRECVDSHYNSYGRYFAFSNSSVYAGRIRNILPESCCNGVGISKNLYEQYKQAIEVFFSSPKNLGIKCKSFKSGKVGDAGVLELKLPSFDEMLKLTGSRVRS